MSTLRKSLSSSPWRLAALVVILTGAVLWITQPEAVHAGEPADEAAEEVDNDCDGECEPRPVGEHRWSKRFGDSGWDEGYAVAVDDEKNVYVTGTFHGSVDFGGGALESAAGGDVFVAKYDHSGDHLWSKRFGGAKNDEGQSVAVDGDGNVYVTGIFWDRVQFGEETLSSAGYRDIFLVKFDGSGEALWSRHFAGTGYDGPDNVVVDDSGHVYLSGSFSGMAAPDNAKQADFGGKATLCESDGCAEGNFLIKYDESGHPLWSRHFDDKLWIQRIAVDPSGHIYVTGTFSETFDFVGGTLTNPHTDCVADGCERDIFLCKFDPSADPMWCKSLGGSGADYTRDIAADGSEHIYLTGAYKGSADFGGAELQSEGDSDIFLAKYKESGELIWQKSFGSDSADSAESLAVDPDGHLYLTGSNGPGGGAHGSRTGVDFGGGPLSATGAWDIFVAKLDSSGQHIWSKRFGESRAETGYDLAVDGDGNVYATGYFYEAVDFGGGMLDSAGKRDIFLMSLSP